MNGKSSIEGRERDLEKKEKVQKAEKEGRQNPPDIDIDGGSEGQNVKTEGKSR